MIFCINHPERKHQARGLCKNCYDKWLKENNTEYKLKQLSNTTAWARKNPERMKIIYERRKEKQRNDPNFKLKTREKTLKAKYNITEDDYKRMLSEQNGVCKICGRGPSKLNNKLHIDHCHKTKRIRGLLCHQCNWYLGVIDDNIDILNKIKDYLKEPLIKEEL